MFNLTTAGDGQLHRDYVCTKWYGTSYMSGWPHHSQSVSIMECRLASYIAHGLVLQASKSLAPVPLAVQTTEPHWLSIWRNKLWMGEGFQSPDIFMRLWWTSLGFREMYGVEFWDAGWLGVCVPPSLRLGPIWTQIPTLWWEGKKG